MPVEFSAKVLWLLLESLLTWQGVAEAAYSNFLKKFAPFVIGPSSGSTNSDWDQLSPLQRFARYLCVGEYQKALELVGDTSSLWSHSLIVSNVISRDAYNHTIYLYTKYL